MTERIWFTSDLHLFHRTIPFMGRGRPWDNAEEMTEGLIENWNDVVQKQDRVYHLGDFSFGNADQTTEALKRLKGQIHMIRGNHDGALDQALKRDPKLVVTYQQYKEIKVDGQRIVLFHFPILSWHGVHKGSWHLHGHSHNNLTFQNGLMLDVGVDAQSWTPVEFESVKEWMENRPVKTWDHHQEDL